MVEHFCNTSSHENEIGQLPGVQSQSNSIVSYSEIHSQILSQKQINKNTL